MTKTINQTLKAPIASTSRRRSKRLRALVMALLHCAARPRSESTPIGRRSPASCQRTLSAVDLLAHDSQRPLIDGSGVPGLNGGEIGLADLVARARPPAVAAKKFCGGGECVVGTVEVAADPVLENIFRQKLRVADLTVHRAARLR